jgi:hypothetical protein
MDTGGTKSYNEHALGDANRSSFESGTIGSRKDEAEENPT